MERTVNKTEHNRTIRCEVKTGMAVNAPVFLDEYGVNVHAYNGVKIDRVKESNPVKIVKVNYERITIHNLD